MLEANIDARRTGLPYLPHLLPPYQHHLLPHFLLPRLRFRLLSRCILESGPCIQESYKYNGCHESWKTRRRKSSSILDYTPRQVPFVDDDCVSLGGRRLHFRHMHGWLVDFLRYHACILGFPDQHSCW